MHMIILSGNPKKDGLCQTLIDAVKEGALEGGATIEEIRLIDLNLNRCQVCNGGWGTCLNDRRCQYGSDGLDCLIERLQTADILVLATPVYWGEMSEIMKCCLDRLRRCVRGADGQLAGRQVLIVATPGGSGNGQLSCFEQMDRFCRHTGLIIFDYIGANRWTADYQRRCARSAAFALAKGRKNGDTVTLSV
ncbi:MAG: flavodoxin family protein [Clostridia bacterium]|nr:flavodoxin family protein [Clostridia bacterium]